MEPPLTFEAELVEKAVAGSVFDGMDGVLDPRRKYISTLTIPFQTGIKATNKTIFPCSRMPGELDLP